ncbi:DUF637 domain-containing protein [Acinetobacter radioresistens]|uniref:two-partner secretion domain-containing protein n=1 Tax=Acinetobacter radioresistens TaxID=40216 RepID=UPI002003E8A3|nr:DUF637 domain-containing protein [Acinetobacter radioresistens]MCK4106607.1 filamentous hemagglutinin N-terminal domain-containing protein [Acinetobacter radioresistens]
MNKTRYRIIFNKARQVFMAVAENVKSQTKTSGQSQGHVSASESTQPFHQLWQVKCLVTSISLWMTLAPAYAQIQADPTASAANRPVVGVGQNAQGQNVPVVNIQTPKNGVSHNIYKQMDVLAEGAVLNNSRTGASSNLVGTVGANPFLAKGEARIILNEVNSSIASRLEGNLEIAGQRADLIIANPAGINIKGGGFINASKAILTTGKPQLNADGSIQQFVIDQGKVTVTANTGSTLGLGGNSNNADYIDIYTRALELNAQLHANQDINVITGTNTISASLENIGSKTSTVAAPILAVDIKSLGGMYADSIYITGTEKGLGVSNAGTLLPVNNLIITNAGKIENSGIIRNTNLKSGLVQIQTTGSNTNADIINNSGTISSNGSLSLDSVNNIILDHTPKRSTASIQVNASKSNSALVLAAKGDITKQSGVNIVNSGSGGVFVEANNIDFQGGYDQFISLGEMYVQARGTLTIKTPTIATNNLQFVGNKGINLLPNSGFVPSSHLTSKQGSIYLESISSGNENNIQLNGNRISAAKDFNIYSSGSLSLNNLDFIEENNTSIIKNINLYSGKNLTWNSNVKALPKISGKVQLEAAGTIDLQGKLVSAKDNIQLQADHLQIGTELVSEKGIDLVSKADDLELYQALTAQNDINVNSLAGGLSTNNLRAVSKSGKIALLAHRDVNISSGQTSTAMPSARLDELTTSKSSLAADQGIIIGSIGEGKVTVKATDLNAENGTIQLSGQNDIAVDGNTDAKVNGDAGQHIPVNSIFNAKSILIKNKKGNINIKDAQLSSTADQLYINSEMGKATIDHTQLKSKGNTEIFAKDILTLKNVTADSDQHLAINTKRTLYLNADYTPATVWDPLAKTALTAKGILSLTAEGNQVMQNATLTGGAFLLETGNLYVKPGLIFNATGSELLKNDAQLNSLNGDLSIQASGGNGLIIDPKIMNLSATGDIELTAKKGVLKLAGYGGTQGNGSEQVVKLVTNNGGIKLEGNSVETQGAQISAQENIDIISSKDDVLIDGVKNNLINRKSEQQLKIYINELTRLNIALKNEESNIPKKPRYAEYQIQLDKILNQRKIAIQMMSSTSQMQGQQMYGYTLRLEAELNNQYPEILGPKKEIQTLITETQSNINYFNSSINGYEHAESNFNSNKGNINILSANGISISGGNISAKTGNVEIEAQGALPDLYTSATTKGVNGQSTQLGASIIIDGHINFYDRGNENDANYSMRTLLSPTIIDGNKGVNIRATGNTVQDNLILQATGITSVNGDIKIEANKSILFDAAIEQSYDRSTKTEKKKSWGGLKKKTITTVTENNNAGAASVDISGKNIFIESKEKDNTNNIDIYSGSLIANGGQVSIKSGGNINLYTVEESSSSNVDITKKSSFAGIKYNKSNTNATRTQVTELPGILKADYIGVKAENDVRLEGTEFEYLQGATIEAGRDLSLITASNMITNIIKKQKNSVVWQSMQDKGSITETAKLPSFNGPVPVFKAAGGLSVQVPINEKDANKVELRDEILKLANQPGNAYLKELVNRKDIDWQTILLTQKDWDYKSQGLTGAGAAIIAIIVAVATYGAGVAALGTTTVAASGGATTVTVGTTTVAVGAGGSATVFGSTVLATTTAAGVTTYTTTGVMINAALTSLASQTSVSLVNNQGNIAKTLKDLGSKDTVKNLATAVVTGGLLDKVGGTATMESLKALGNTPDILMNLAAKTATAIIETTVKTGINSAITGGSFSEGLDDLLYQSLGTAIQGTMANHIHLNKEIISDGLMKNILSQVAHATAGCTGAVIGGGECVAGAIGAAVGESVAEYMKQYSSDQKLITNISNAMAVTIAAATGYDTDIAQRASETAVTNNAFWVPLIAAVTIADRAYSAYQIYRDVQDIVDGKKSLEQLATEKGTAYVERAILGNLTSKGLGIVSEGGKKVIKRVTYIAPEKEITELFTKTNSRNTLTIAGLDIKKAYNPVNSSTTTLLDSQKLTANDIKSYAQQFAGHIPLKAVGNGDKLIYTAQLENGQQVILRNISTSASSTNARWTLQIINNPELMKISGKKSYEIKFK